MGVIDQGDSGGCSLGACPERMAACCVFCAPGGGAGVFLYRGIGWRVLVDARGAMVLMGVADCNARVGGDCFHVRRQ